MTRVCLGLTVGTILSFASHVSLAIECVDLTIDDCLNGSEQKVGVSKEKLEKDKPAELAQINTGSAGTAGGSSTIDDFNPFMQLITDNLSGGTDSGDVSVAFNDLFNQWLGEQFKGKGKSLTGHNYKLTLSLPNSGLYEPLSEAVMDANLENELNKQVQSTDDVMIGLRVNFQTKRWGRRFDNHVDYLDEISNAVNDKVKNQVVDANVNFNAFLDAIGDECGYQGSGADLDSRTLGDICGVPLPAKINELIERVKISEARFERMYELGLNSSGYEEFVALINNQPQFVFAYTARQRNELVGPDEKSASLKYEFGGIGINALKQECEDPADLDCLRRFFGNNKSAIRAGSRLSIVADYKERDPWQYNDNGISLSQGKEKSVTGTLSYGRYIDLGLDDSLFYGASRLEVVGSYEDVMNDPVRDDRGIVTVSFTQSVASGFVVGLNVIWASKPEYRGGVDDEISANIGVNYKIGQGDK